MRFTKVIGQTENPAILAVIRAAEIRLTEAFMELSMSVSNRGFFSNIGGSPLTYQLMYPLPHYCDISALILKDLEARVLQAKGTEKEELERQIAELNLKNPRGVLTTAATNGKAFFFNPEFICSLSNVGIRLVLEHEALHAILGHSDRRQGRNHSLWNICIDYIVNRFILLDLQTRGHHSPENMFKDNLGDFIRLDEYAAILKDPFNPPPRLAHLNPIHMFRAMANPGYQDPAHMAPPMFFADAKIGDDFRRPEYIYTHLYNIVPKCEECGRFGCYKKPAELKKLEKQIEERRDNESLSS